VADGNRIGELPGSGHTFWIGLLAREGAILRPHLRTRLAAGDRLLVLTEPADEPATRALFVHPASWTSES
jgi:NhaP-type Na+/H+ and K+/H+ antiporter